MNKCLVLTVVAMSSLMSCASSSLSKEEKRAENDRIMAEWKAAEAARAVKTSNEAETLRVGCTTDAFKAVFGEPHTIVEQTEKNTVVRYYVDSQPMIVVFEGGKVSAIREDNDERARQVASQSVRAQQDQATAAKEGNSIARSAMFFNMMNANRTRTTTCNRGYRGSVECVSN